MEIKTIEFYEHFGTCVSPIAVARKNWKVKKLIYRCVHCAGNAIYSYTFTRIYRTVDMFVCWYLVCLESTRAQWHVHKKRAHTSWYRRLLASKRSEKSNNQNENRAFTLMPVVVKTTCSDSIQSPAGQRSDAHSTIGRRRLGEYAAAERSYFHQINSTRYLLCDSKIFILCICVCLRWRLCSVT